MEEGEGFEPIGRPHRAINGFQDRRNKPDSANPPLIIFKFPLPPDIFRSLYRLLL